jgi:hypothetical protein
MAAYSTETYVIMEIVEDGDVSEEAGSIGSPSGTFTRPAACIGMPFKQFMLARDSPVVHPGAIRPLCPQAWTLDNAAITCRFQHLVRMVPT